MVEKLKKIKLNVTLSAVLTAIIGVLLLIYPTESIATIGKLIAVFVILTGIVMLISQFFEFGMNIMGMIVGGVVAVIGIWMFASPTAIMTIIPIAIGVMICVHGIQDLTMAIEGAKAKASRPWIPFLFAAINILLGLVCIAHAFGLVSVAFRIIGIMLIWDGVSDIFIVRKVTKATKDIVDSVITEEEDIF